MDPTPGVRAALTAARAALEASDATITIAAEAPSGGGLLPSWLPARRNAIPYAWYALLATIALLFINGSAGGTAGARAVAVAFDLAVPAGIPAGGGEHRPAVRTHRDGRKPKNLRLGLVICAVPLALGVALSRYNQGVRVPRADHISPSG